jgi:N-hydroxyarylamine O-acetyltransferase
MEPGRCRESRMTAFQIRQMTSIDAYLRRIGYTGERSPTLATLRALHRLHPAAIPFENLDPWLGRPVRLEIEALEEKLVVGGRGGYCFEHNVLFGHILETLDCEVARLAARVLWNQPDDAAADRNHMLLRVRVEDADCIVDTGFGGLTLTSPLRLEPDLEQATPHETFRLRALGEDYRIEARIRGEWKALYGFDLRARTMAEFEARNRHLSTHPESRFRTALVAARTTPDRRYALSDTEFAVHPLNGPTERRRVASARELRSLLGGTFGLNLEGLDALDAALERLTRTRAPRAGRE